MAVKFWLWQINVVILKTISIEETINQRYIGIQLLSLIPSP
jgi:hypothetical protein